MRDIVYYQVDFIIWGQEEEQIYKFGRQQVRDVFGIYGGVLRILKIQIGYILLRYQFEGQVEWQEVFYIGFYRG